MFFYGGHLRDFRMPAGPVWLLTDNVEAKGCQTFSSTQQAPQVLKALHETALV
jgi:hypothetical protein